MATNGMVEGCTREEMSRFETLLLERRALMVGDVQALEQERAVADASPASIHLAEFGSDQAATDISLGFRESASAEIQEIDEALERIRDGSFGHCESCDQWIATARLEAIPYARLCLACKMQEEN